jgi:NADH dehydrogenase FAD-containing subunit
MVYAAGDAAAIRRGENYLRKAVNFSRGSGTVAGRNVARALEDDLPEPFHPVDLGWVIPFCDVGVGRLFSRYAMRGRIPLFLHYLMCGVRNYEAANRIHFWKRAIRTLFS